MLRIAILVATLSTNVVIASTIRIATYNVLDFPQSFGLERLDDFRLAMANVNPDILVVQEMQSQSGVEMFLDSVMLPLNSAFTSIPFHDGPDTDNALFFRQDKVDCISANYISTPNRDMAEYRLLLNDNQRELRVFSVHFKASQGSSNEAIRLQEAGQDVTKVGLDYDGPGVCRAADHICIAIPDRVRPEHLEYEEEHGRDIFDVIVGIALHVGMEQGIRWQLDKRKTERMIECMECKLAQRVEGNDLPAEK